MSSIVYVCKRCPCQFSLISSRGPDSYSGVETVQIFFFFFRQPKKRGSISAPEFAEEGDAWQSSKHRDAGTCPNMFVRILT